MYVEKDFVFCRKRFVHFWGIILCIWEINLCLRGNILYIVFGNILCISENIWRIIKERFIVFQKSFGVIQEIFCALLKKDFV